MFLKAPLIWYTEPTNIKQYFLSKFLQFLALIYHGILIFKKLTSLTPYRSHIPVICVGNLTLGGQGKTPICLTIANIFASNNIKAIILSRGYGGTLKCPTIVNNKTHQSHQTGDEPLFMAKYHDVVIAKSKKHGIKFIETLTTKDNLPYDMIILDDGLQNSTIKKDHSFIVMNSWKSLGNKKLFPAGPLREPLGFLKMDNMSLIVTNKEKFQNNIDVIIKEKIANRQIFTSKIIYKNWQQIKDLQKGGKKIIAFCAIGNPDKFFASFEENDIHLSGKISFANHYQYQQNDYDRLLLMAKKDNAQLVTTEKDFIRLENNFAINIICAKIQVKILPDEKFSKFIISLCPQKNKN